ncbi:MAG TPA: TetR/AcrR family transcriptional regulator [Mycobacteriales bacterium]|nr:TetR/AcrR family transcriptional regulator [Mycobacteriales bacterium]
MDTAPVGTRIYGGVTAERRREQRRQRLVDAGLELFGTRGVAAVGIVDICAEAGLTKRYFYESFASIDELASAVFEQVTDRLVEQVVPAIMAGGGQDPRPALTAYFNGALADPRIVRLLAVEGRTGTLARYGDGFATRAVELWFAFTPRVDGQDDAALRLRAYAFAGAITQVGLALHDGALNLTVERIIDELVDIFNALVP